MKQFPTKYGIAVRCSHWQNVEAVVGWAPDDCRIEIKRTNWESGAFLLLVSRYNGIFRLGGVDAMALAEHQPFPVVDFTDACADVFTLREEIKALESRLESLTNG